MLIVKWILQKFTPQWSICNQLDKLRGIVSGRTQELKCTRIFKKENWVADALSKHSHKISCPEIYSNRKELTKEAKSYYQLDLMEKPWKKTKKIKEQP